MKRILLPGEADGAEVDLKPPEVKWYNENERAIICDEKIIVERIYKVEKKYGNGKIEIDRVKSTMTQHRSGRQDITIAVPTMKTKPKTRR